MEPTSQFKVNMVVDTLADGTQDVGPIVCLVGGISGRGQFSRRSRDPIHNVRGRVGHDGTGALRISHLIQCQTVGLS